MFFDRQSLRRIGRCVQLNERQPPGAIEANRWNAAKQWFWVRIIGAGSSGTYKFRRIKWTGINVYVDIDAADRDWLCSAVALSAGDTMVAECVGEHFPTAGYRQPMYRVRKRAAGGIPANTSHGSATFTTAGDFTWTCPASGVYQTQSEEWGGGGGGGDSGYYLSGGGSGGGGGGGAYSKSLVIAVSASVVYNGHVGAAGAEGYYLTPVDGSPGEDSWFKSTSDALAKGGGGGGTGTLLAAGAAGAGGAVAGGIGDVKYRGGNASPGSMNDGSTESGAGGSSAGTASDGNDASVDTGGAAPTGGGRGASVGLGAGRTATQPGGGGSLRNSPSLYTNPPKSGQVILAW